jgi:hypothetical protein
MVNKILDKVLNVCCADGGPFAKHDEPEEEAHVETSPVKKTEESKKPEEAAAPAKAPRVAPKPKR